jgi:hypothetical protein
LGKPITELSVKLIAKLSSSSRKIISITKIDSFKKLHKQFIRATSKKWKTYELAISLYDINQCFSTFFPMWNPFGKRKCLQNPYAVKNCLAEPLQRKNFLKQSLLEANIA